MPGVAGTATAGTDTDVGILRATSQTAEPQATDRIGIAHGEGALVSHHVQIPWVGTNGTGGVNLSGSVSHGDERIVVESSH